MTEKKKDNRDKIEDKENNADKVNKAKELKKENVKKEVKSKQNTKLKESEDKKLSEKEEKKQKTTKESKMKKGKEDKEVKDKIKYFKYIKHLLLTEKAIDNINLKNTLVFIVDRRANKPLIKREVENIFEVKVEKVNTLIDRKGRKKAYVKLAPDYNAIDIATQLGMM